MLSGEEKQAIETALRESRGRVSGSSGAAAKLGVPRSTLESRIRSLKIDKNRFKAFKVEKPNEHLRLLIADLVLCGISPIGEISPFFLEDNSLLFSDIRLARELHSYMARP